MTKTSARTVQAMARHKDSQEQIANLAGGISGMADFSPEE